METDHLDILMPLGLYKEYNNKICKYKIGLVIIALRSWIGGGDLQTCQLYRFMVAILSLSCMSLIDFLFNDIVLAIKKNIERHEKLKQHKLLMWTVF